MPATDTTIQAINPTLVQSLKTTASKKQVAKSIDKQAKSTNEQQIKAKLVYYYYKSALHDIHNYHTDINTIRFKKVVDKYFKVLENTPNQNYFQKVTIIYQSFGERETDIFACEDQVFNKIYPFNKIKEDLLQQIKETYQVIFN